MRALWLERKNPNEGEDKATCHRDRKAVGTLRCHQDWRCSRPSRLKANPRSDRPGRHPPGVDGAAMRSVLVKEPCRGTRRVSGEVRRRPGSRYRAISLSGGRRTALTTASGRPGRTLQTGRPGSLRGGFPSVIAKRAGQSTAWALAAYCARASSMMAGKLCSAVSWACLIALSVTRAAAIC